MRRGNRQGRAPASEVLQAEEKAASIALDSSRAAEVQPSQEETAAAIERVQTMMSDVDTGWSEVIEVRVLTTSDADRAETAAMIAADPRLAALPVSYRVVDQLSAPRSRVSLDVLARSKAAVAATARRYGPGSPTTK